MRKIKKPKKSVSLISKINRNLEKKANPYYGPDYKPKPNMKPSDFGTKSLRKLFYSYLKTPKDRKLDAKIKRIFDTGDALHGMMRQWVRDAANDDFIFIDYKDPETGEIPINKYSKQPDPEFPMLVEELGMTYPAKIDGLVILDDKLWIVEFKSMKTEKFESLKKALEEHEFQANTYAFLFEHCLNRGDYDHIEELDEFSEVAGVIYIYLDKNVSEPKEFVVEKNVELLEPAIEKVTTVLDYVEKKELPPCQNCDYFCDWKKKCAKDYNPLKEE